MNNRGIKIDIVLVLVEFVGQWESFRNWNKRVKCCNGVLEGIRECFVELRFEGWVGIRQVERGKSVKVQWSESKVSGDKRLFLYSLVVWRNEVREVV